MLIPEQICDLIMMKRLRLSVFILVAASITLFSMMINNDYWPCMVFIVTVEFETKKSVHALTYMQ